MPWYKVTATIEVPVEADDEDQAKDIAMERVIIDAENAGIVIGTLEVETDDA